MKVFVTGATGYIGGTVAEKLVASGHKVRGRPPRLQGLFFWTA